MKDSRKAEETKERKDANENTKDPKDGNAAVKSTTSGNAKVKEAEGTAPAAPPKAGPDHKSGQDSQLEVMPGPGECWGRLRPD